MHHNLLISKAMTSVFVIIGLFLIPFIGRGQYSGTGTFTEVTTLEGIESGSYYVFYGINSTYSGAMTNTISSGRMGNTAVTITENTVVNPATSIVWLVQGNGTDGFTVFNESVSRYCEITVNSTSGFSLSATSTHAYDAILNGAKGIFFRSKHSSAGNRGISIYQTDWRPYAAAGAYNMRLFKYTPAASGPADPQSFSATASGATQINLSAIANVAGNNILVAYNSSNTFGTPTGSYSSGNPITGGGTVLYSGSAGSLTNHTGLSSGQTVYYKAWSYDGNDYSLGLIANATTFTPTILVVDNTLSGFTYVFGAGPSTSQTYNLSGSNLTGFPGNITVSGSTNYEVSTNNSSFSSSVNVPFTEATLASTLIYVRLKSGLAVGNYNSETIANAGGGATTQNVTVSGSVTSPPPPTITVTPTSLSGFTYVFGAGPSTSQTYSLSGSNLTGFPGNITVSGSTNYEVSTDNSSFSSSVNVPFTEATLASTPIYVRLKSGLAVGNYNSETIANAGGGATTQNVTVSGSVTAPPPPEAPVAIAATGIGATSFTANWEASAGATGYFLDVYTKTAGTNTTDLFISEYVEGSSNNKAIEIFNGTGATVDLSNYTLKKQVNGAGSFGSDLVLSGTLANNNVYVVANSSSVAGILNVADLSTTSGVVTFNGNDAVALYKSGVQIDVVGIVDQVSPDWGANVTLVRKSSISEPTVSYSISDWDSYASDTFTYLGSHTFSGGSSSTFVSGFEDLDVGNVTTYEVTGLDPNTTYYYIVRATNDYGTSDNSNEIEVTTLAAVGLPVVADPTASNVGETSATLGGNITSDGGSTITERGTLWSLTPGVTISNNKLAEGGTSTGIFSHSRTGLPSGTLIYFRAYAINANGTSLSEEDSFTTLAAEPANHATGFSGVSIAPTQNTITLTWTNPSPASESYLIKGVVGAGPVTDPVDLTPESDDWLVKNLNATAESYTFTSLTPETTYTFKIFPYNGTGTDVNYLVTGAPSATATTAAVIVQTYAWIGEDAGSWATAANWNPSRTSPENTDILQFNDGATKTITGVTSQTIGKISVSNNTKITLQAASASNLTVAGGTGVDLILEAGSELNISGSNALVIALSAGATASIDGAMTFAGGAHKLTAADASGITFNNGAVFTAGTGFSGNAFNNVTANSVIFGTGSTYRYISGSNPFALTLPASVVVFQAGSTYQQLSSSAPSVSGRTYSNFEYDFNGTLTITGSVASSFDNLTVLQGTLNMNVTGLVTHSIKGNINVQTGATLNFNPSSAGTLNLNGTSQQLISGGGTITSNSNSALIINNSEGIILNNNASLMGNIQIESSSALTINSGRNLTVSGALTNNAGNTGLIIKSDATGTGSLIHSTASVPATIERYITGSSNLTENKYHLVSVPLAAANNPQAGLFLGSYLYFYDQPTQSFLSPGTSTTSPLDVQRGYMIYYPNASTTYNFAGTMNAGPFTANTSHHSVTIGLETYTGFNLVPNPYPTAIDWDAASGWTKTYINDAIWIWNPGSGNYAAYGDDAGTNGATRYIPAGQAFFVQSSAADPVLTMNNDVRVHNSQAFFKDASMLKDMLRLSATSNGFSDELIVRFLEPGSVANGQKNVAKMTGSASAPQLYSMSAESEKLSINSLPFSAETVIIPLGFALAATKEASFSFSGIDSFEPTVTIFLEDLLTGQMINLREQPSYSFSHVQGNNPLRFNLHFMGVTSVDENSLVKDHKIWSYNDRIYISIPGIAGEQALIELFDLLGNKLDAYNLRLNSPTVLQSRHSGVVIVRVIAGNRVYTSKLFIR